MANRLDLHEELCGVLGTNNVYFDPPASVKMNYDAIRYTRAKMDGEFANNSIYMHKTRYEVIAIYRDADSDLPLRLLSLPMCGHDRHYFADNLHHDVFTIYR